MQELPIKTGERLITKQMVAKRLSVSTRTVDRMTKEGILKKVYLRDTVRFREHDIDQIVANGI
ncbi:MAG: hypothetical protein H7A51_15890 [Akkermansiaceae bacterium]|nr:hypothetical protein [Akkermansiaceae bacterium]